MDRILNTPKECINLDGVVFSLDKDFIIREDRDFIKVEKLNSSFDEVANYKKKGSVRYVCKFENMVYFRDNASVVTPGDLYSLDISTGCINHIGPSAFKLAVKIGDANSTFFSVDSGTFCQVDLGKSDSFDIRKIRSVEFPSLLPLLSSENIFTLGLQGEMCSHSLDGKLLWKKNLKDTIKEYSGSEQNVSVNNCIFLYRNLVLCHVKPYTLLALNIFDGEVQWIAEDAVQNQWVTA